MHVQVEANFVVSGHGGSGLIGANLGVEADNAGDSANGWDWDSEFIRLFGRDSLQKLPD